MSLEAKKEEYKEIMAQAKLLKKEIQKMERKEILTRRNSLLSEALQKISEHPNNRNPILQLINLHDYLDSFRFRISTAAEALIRFHQTDNENERDLILQKERDRHGLMMSDAQFFLKKISKDLYTLLKRNIHEDFEILMELKTVVSASHLKMQLRTKADKETIKLAYLGGVQAGKLKNFVDFLNTAIELQPDSISVVYDRGVTSGKEFVQKFRDMYSYPSE